MANIDLTQTLCDSVTLGLPTEVLYMTNIVVNSFTYVSIESIHSQKAIPSVGHPENKIKKYGVDDPPPVALWVVSFLDGGDSGSISSRVHDRWRAAVTLRPVRASSLA